MASYNKLDNVDINDPFADSAKLPDYDDDFIVPDNTSSKKQSHNSQQQPYNPPQSIGTESSSSSLKKTYRGGYFSINYYRQYFDLNTSDFFSNCISSLNPISQPPVDEFSKIGDLYGCVWITASLIFFLFFCNSFAGLLSGWILGLDLDSLKINYFKMIISSINLLYGYTFIIPIILYLLLRFYFKVLMLVPITKLISIYSYANLLWIPAVFLSIFRGLLINHATLDSVLKWGCIIVGALLSGCSIIYKLKIYLTSIFGNEDQKTVYVILALLILAHAGFTIGVKVCFFGKL